MADFTSGPNGSGGSIPAGSVKAGKFVNIAAASVSVALVGGVGIWGYKLLMRDVTGVPVVQAMAGEMRVAPENPGGEIASNVGLSVNAVPAIGGAAEPEDRLVLAPNSIGLAAEDLEVVPTAEAAEVQPDPVPEAETVEAIPVTLTEDDTQDAPQVVAALATPVDPSTPLTADDVLALADQIAAGAAPLSELSAGEDVPVEVAVNGVAVDPNIIPDAVPGVRRSPRPASRPAALRTTPTPTPAAAPVVQAAASAGAVSAAQAAAPVTGEVTTAALPAGTKLVQLGAFDSADIAATEWLRLTGRFPEFFDGKEQIIQEAASGGRTFYRLRAMGFADLSDARRFCSAMSAEGAACIPVVVR